MVVMGRISYACVDCGQHFTRHTSARRHNINLHKEKGKIVTYLQYVAGVKAGKYRVVDKNKKKSKYK